MPPVRYRDGGFPPAELDLQRLLPLVGPANAELAREHAPLRVLRPDSGRRPAVLAFPELLNIAEGKDVL